MNLDFFNLFKECLNEMDTLGNEYASAKSISWHSQELKGSILASLMKDCKDMPVSKAEIEAKASEDYKQFLSETADYIKKELQLKAKYEKAKARFEAYRSLCSLEKKIIDKSE